MTVPLLVDIGAAVPFSSVGASAIPFLLVGAGGVLGALARHLVGERVGRSVDAPQFGTLVVNVCGSFALGVVLAAPVGDAAALAFGTGFCGAFTTFSSFAFETVRLFETGRRRRTLANAAVNLVGALAAVGLGSLVGGLL